MIDRLPTQSAAEALQDIENGSVNAFISSGIPSLDHGLTGNSNLAKPGFERGKVAEIWGPPGGGKTSLAWVDFGWFCRVENVATN